ncbi:hypothetical protein NDU88_007883, partial [Pleurodeles waltl]
FYFLKENVQCLTKPKEERNRNNSTTWLKLTVKKEDNSIAVPRYITSYITKSKKTETKDLWEKISTEKPISNKLYSFSLKMLFPMEISSFEDCERINKPIYCNNI